MRKFLTPMIAVLSLAGCAHNPSASWVGGVSPKDGKVIGSDLGAYVASQLPSVKSSVWVQPMDGNERGPVIDSLENTLRQKGYPVLPDSASRPTNAHLIRFLVSGKPAWGETNAFILIDGKEASREYVKDTLGALRPAGPFSVRE